MIVGAALGLALLSGCGCKQCGGGNVVRKKDGQVIKTISLEELAEQKDTLRLINVLAPDTYNDCHIPGSINIPLDNLEQASQDWDKHEQIVVYCASAKCPMGRMAFAKLKALGFTKVRDFEGGTRAWLHAGHPVNGPCRREYLHSAW